jgi:hypothetical protein
MDQKIGWDTKRAMRQPRLQKMSFPEQTGALCRDGHGNLPSGTLYLPRKLDILLIV